VAFTELGTRIFVVDTHPTFYLVVAPMAIGGKEAIQLRNSHLISHCLLNFG